MGRCRGADSVLPSRAGTRVAEQMEDADEDRRHFWSRGSLRSEPCYIGVTVKEHQLSADGNVKHQSYDAAADHHDDHGTADRDGTACYGTPDHGTTCHCTTIHVTTRHGHPGRPRATGAVHGPMAARPWFVPLHLRRHRPASRRELHPRGHQPTGDPRQHRLHHLPERVHNDDSPVRVCN